MKTTWGGKRAGAGRPLGTKKKQESSYLLALSKEEIITEYELKLKRAKERLIAEVSHRLDYGGDQVKCLLDAGMLPPAFSQALNSTNRAQERLQVVKQNLEQVSMDKLKQLSFSIQAIEESY